MRIKKLSNYIILKNKILRYSYFTKFKKIGAKIFILLNKKKEIKVGLYSKQKKRNTKYLIYKTLYYSYNLCNYNYKDYFNVIKKDKIRSDYYFNLNKKKKVLSVFDLFCVNKVLSFHNFVPVFSTKLEYNLYDKNYRILQIYKFISYKNINKLYLQYNNYNNYNNNYYYNLYVNYKNKILDKLRNVLFNYNLHCSNFKVLNIFNIINQYNFS
jgi:hypothetical protein